MLKTGDINVTVGGDLTLTGGGFGGGFTQIGHGGNESYGQVGGDFDRDVRIPDIDGVMQAVNTTINGTTANIVVDVAGDILMNHLAPNNPYTTTSSAKFSPNDAYSLIGHGGSATQLNADTASSNSVRYWNKTGDVTVTTAGSLTMESGGGSNGWYSRVGHGATRRDRQSNGREALYSGAVVVNVGTDLVMNANKADNEFGDPRAGGAFSDQASRNPVAIGHGGTSDHTRINFDGDVTVTVGGDATMKSGKGLEGSYAQIGNGGSGGFNTSGNADDVGEFTGDVTVDITGSLTMQANPDGQVYTVDPTASANFDEIVNSYVLIGNGGAQWRSDGTNDTATADGKVIVTVSTDLTMTAVNRQQAAFGPDGSNNWARVIGGFVQIGNANSGQNSLGTANGDVYVEVGNDLTMTGGLGEGDAVEAANIGAFAQIGNGGAQMDGSITGDVEVRVGNNLRTYDGNGIHDAYVKIGHGDWQRDDPTRSGSGTRSGDISVNVGNTANFDHTLVGHRDLAAGFPSDDSSGTTIVGVSRANPFFGGAGQLIATNGSVFTSGVVAGILFDELRFYMPGRSSNLLAMDTRLNSGAVTFVGNEGGVDFAAPTEGAVRGTMGEMPSFQREDEIYLQPDWWSDNSGTGGGTAFPGGSLAEVNAPGGFDNLAGAPTAGSLGGGTAVNAHGEVTYLGAAENSLGNYTLYYDAIETVAPFVPGGGGTGGGGAPIGGGGFSSPSVPTVVIPPFVPDVDLFSFLFFSQSGADLFGYTERDYLIMGDVVDGGGDTQEGLEAQQPHWLFGVSNRVLTPEEEARERRRRARYQWQVSNGGRTFWVYDVNSRQYSSFRQFGSPHGPSVAQ